MKAIFVFLFALPIGVVSGSASTIRGAVNERDEILRNFGHEISSHAKTLSAPPLTEVTVRQTATAGVLKASSHVVQWGSARNGCSYSLPQVTVSCGVGATIALGQKASTVTGCVTKSGNTLVCSSEASPTTNPQVTVTCFGTTSAQLTVTVQVPASQATCNSILGIFPQSDIIFRGGAASVFALLGRYCTNSENKLYLNTNYTCGSADKSVTQAQDALSFCVADGSCTARLFCNSTTPEQSCLGSCSDQLAAVTVSDPDSRAECVNVGPRPAPLPAGLHGVTWSTFHQHCSSSANTVTASCGTGGAIAIASTSSNAVHCTTVGTNSLSCTKNATLSSASVVFYCYGTTMTARTATAVLPSSSATDCSNPTVTSSINVASQAIILNRFCGNGTLIPRPSAACGKASQVLVSQSNGVPICISSNECTSTVRSSCSIPLDSVSVSDPSTDPSCTVLGPQSINF
jgi:hypothetical protein